MICSVSAFLQTLQRTNGFYFSQMSSLSASTYISIDHTFKVTANIGYLRADGRWITHYNSLFIVLNNIGQVIAWQFTRTTSTDECEDFLYALKDRCTWLGQPVMEVYVDNCCQSRNKLQPIFGQDTRVCLDIFHAAQRITNLKDYIKTLSSLPINNEGYQASLQRPLRYWKVADFTHTTQRHPS